MKAAVLKTQSIPHRNRDLGVYQLRVFEHHPYFKNGNRPTILAEVTNGDGEPDWIGRAASEICRLEPVSIEGAMKIIRGIKK